MRTGLSRYSRNHDDTAKMCIRDRWETLVIALAAAAVCVVCAMLICKAVKKNLSKKTAAVIGAAAFAGAVLAVIVIARTPMPL